MACVEAFPTLYIIADSKEAMWWGGGGGGGGCSLERKIHLIDWKNVSKSKEKGGLGIRNLHVLNRALLRKWAWRFATNERAT